jgi:histidyl-tRNA synthetase
MDYLDDESRQHFEQLKAILDAAGIQYRINPRLVRGLDYYCKTVFEWVTDDLGAQGTVCAGGRYDGLVEQLGGRATTAAGFALGIERLLSLLEDAGKTVQASCDVFVILQGEQAQLKGLALVENIRNDLPDLVIQSNCGGGSFKSQMKKADKSAASLALIIGEDEIANDTVTIKYLRDDRPQQTVSQQDLLNNLQTISIDI